MLHCVSLLANWHQTDIWHGQSHWTQLEMLAVSPKKESNWIKFDVHRNWASLPPADLRRRAIHLDAINDTIHNTLSLKTIHYTFASNTATDAGRF